MQISPAALPSAARRPLFVSLGDSYSSGMGSEATPHHGGNTVDMGVYGPDGPGYPWRSTTNAASRIARAHGYDLRDVSFAGAYTHNVLETGMGGERPQIEAVTPDAKLVTLTMGVNDTHALDLIWPVRDSELTWNDPRVQNVVALTGAMQAKVGRVLTEITRRAPDAQVRIAGYPYLLPLLGQGGGNAYLSDSERVVMQRVFDGVNDAIRAAAAMAGPNVRFVDPNAPGSPFVAIDEEGPRDFTSPSSKRWVNGEYDGGTRAMSVHPNARGYEYYAQLYEQSLR